MAIHYRTQAIFLKKIDQGESDRVFVLFSKDFGKLEILAKGIRKISSKLKGAAREFCLTEIEFVQGKIYKTLTDAILIDSFENLRKNLKKLKVAFQIAQISEKLIKEQEKDLKIWNLFLETFQRLNNPGLKVRACELLYHFFLWNLLSFLGYQLQIEKCALCQKNLTENLYFSFEEGGAICQKCKKKNFKKILPEIIKILKIALKREWLLLSRLKIKNFHLKLLKNLSQDYLDFVLSLS
jgi:DNA repair protein RecO (recombination protein O)